MIDKWLVVFTSFIREVLYYADDCNRSYKLNELNNLMSSKKVHLQSFKIPSIFSTMTDKTTGVAGRSAIACDHCAIVPAQHRGVVTAV